MEGSEDGGITGHWMPASVSLACTHLWAELQAPLNPRESAVWNLWAHILTTAILPQTRRGHRQTGAQADSSAVHVVEVKLTSFQFSLEALYVGSPAGRGALSHLTLVLKHACLLSRRRKKGGVALKLSMQHKGKPGNSLTCRKTLGRMLHHLRKSSLASAKLNFPSSVFPHNVIPVLIVP